MDLVPNAEGEEGFVFADFALYPARRRLERSGAHVRIGSRSLDILIALVTRAGKVVAKDDLVAFVWPNLIVEESALRVHISNLRKALGDGQNGIELIANIPGRGYSFVAPVRKLGGKAVPVISDKVQGKPPTQLAKIFGRDQIIAEVAESITTGRLVSIVGPGGIGKTTVALAVARRLAAEVASEVVFIDLGQVSESELVVPAIATALGLHVRSGDVLQAIVEATSGRRRLILLLDSCEHVIDEAASAAERLLGSAPDVRILATSREALRAEGERVQRLRPLDLPPDRPDLTATEALAYPAVDLFVDRAAGVLGRYRLLDSDVPLVAFICRRLDGIALAIELATGRLDDMSIAALATSLESSFQILTRGRRTALPRHQTLRGTIDWSYGILSEEERLVLMRISVFVGPFTPQAARAVAGNATISAEDVDELLHALVAKSLLSADADGREARYRLLDTMRAYTSEKLEATGEVVAIRRRHALFYRNLFSRSETSPASPPQSGTLAERGELGNLRAALDWAFSPTGDGAIGVALTVNGIPFWFQLSLIDECIARVQSALAWLDRSKDPDPRARMHLHTALGFPQMRATSGFWSGAAAWQLVLAIAEDIGDAEFKARALWALWTDRLNSGEALQSLGYADRLAELARTDPSTVDARIPQRLRAVSKLTLGRLDEAHRDVADMLARYAPRDRRIDIARFHYDQRSVARVTLARALWLKGLADQASGEVDGNLAEIAATGHTLSIAHVLSDAACFVALWRGDLDVAERHVKALRRHTRRQALDVWQMYAECFEGEIRVRRGDLPGGIMQLAAAITALCDAGFVRYHSAFSGVLADSLRSHGQPDRALATIDEVLSRCASTGEAWCRPELLRIRADALADLGRLEAAQTFEEAFVLAEAQCAPAWMLRIATAELKAANGRAAEGAAIARLQSVLAGIHEGSGTTDVVAARELLAAVR